MSFVLAVLLFTVALGIPDARFPWQAKAKATPAENKVGR